MNAQDSLFSDDCELVTVIGRPFNSQSEHNIVASLENSTATPNNNKNEHSDWSSPLVGDPLEILSGSEWLARALGEHASVASFSVFSLQLLAVGAPAYLLTAAHLAALDEIRHAQISFSLAAIAGGVSPQKPGKMSPQTLLIEPDLSTLAVATFREGCIAETRAALELEKMSEQSGSELILSIAEDEGRHAILAWQTVEWALSQGENSKIRLELTELLLNEEKKLQRQPHLLGFHCLLQELASRVLGTSSEHECTLSPLGQKILNGFASP